MAFDELKPGRVTPEPIQTAPVGETDWQEIALHRTQLAVAACRTILDVTYGEHGQKLDIYLPDSEDHRGLPVLIMIHGGAWQTGQKELLGFIGPAVVDLPAIFVSIQYRLAPAHKYPACLDDTLDAVAWVVRNIERYGGSAERLYLGGHSSGGHLSALVTLRRDLVAQRGLPKDVIKACFPVSGVYNMDSSNPPPGSTEKIVSEALFTSKADEAPASPVNHVAGNTTPFFVTYGGEDVEKMIRNGRALIAALRAQPGRVESHVFPGLSHTDMCLMLGERDTLWSKTVRAWMTGHLEPPDY
jgi:acetyl esterase/lipase